MIPAASGVGFLELTIRVGGLMTKASRLASGLLAWPSSRDTHKNGKSLVGRVIVQIRLKMALHLQFGGLQTAIGRNHVFFKCLHGLAPTIGGF